MDSPLRIVVVAPDLASTDGPDAEARNERTRSLHIGLLQSGFNLIATLPGDDQRGAGRSGGKR